MEYYPEEAICTCLDKIKAAIKKKEYADSVDCTNENIMYSGSSKHSASKLFINFTYRQEKEIRKVKRLAIFISFCPFCGKRLLG